MKLVAVTRILDEADIVEAMVRHTACCVDSHILLDNGSTDGTLEILRSLKDEGFPLTVFADPTVDFNERRALSFLFKVAVDQHGADWVFGVDADEFVDDRVLSLRGFLTDVDATDPDCLCVRIRVRNYLLTEAATDDPVVPHRLIYRTDAAELSHAIFNRRLRGRRVVIHAGSHGAMMDDGTDCPSIVADPIFYAHFPARSGYQILTKSVIGWAKMLAGDPAAVASGTASHYKGPYEMLRTDPGFFFRNPHHLNNFVDADSLTRDPIRYRGDALRYTDAADYELAAVRKIMGYLDKLAKEHGALASRHPPVAEAEVDVGQYAHII